MKKKLIVARVRLKRKIKLSKIEYRYHKQILTRFKNKKSYKKLFNHLLFQVIFRRCGGKGVACGGGYAYLQHSNCAYVDELSNYNFCCEDCHEEIDAMYQEWWDEYNSSRY